MPEKAVSADSLVLYTKEYTYDLAGNRTNFQVIKDGEVVQDVRYTYDKLNRLSIVGGTGKVKAKYTYDVNGNRIALWYNNGIAEVYTYNKANWITSITNRKGNETISSLHYTYYASGSQKSKTDQAGIITSYTYDGLNRLTQEAETGGLTHSYSYDNAGNRAQMTVSGTESYVTTYRYDAANRLLSENRSGDGSAETLYTYDADGNLLTRTATSSDGIAGATYQYDLFGQLVLSNEGGIQAACAYNAQGIRTEKTTSAGWTQYLLDGGNVIGEQTDAELITYLRGVNLISRTAAGNTEYYLFNAHGDVTELTSNRAVVTKTYHYDAFGVETAPDPLDENPFRYCGEYFDVETGTYYLRARYYDPDIGRFTQQDTHWNTANSIYGDNPQKINEREDKLGLKTYSYAPQITAVMQSGNLYVYGVSNPVAYADISGNFVITTATLLIIGGVILLGTAGGLIGNAAANHAGVTGWEKAGYIAGGAAIGAIAGGVAGWAVAPAVVSATGAAGISVTATSISTIAAIGTQFGKLGTLVNNPEITINWSSVTAHAMQRMAERGVTRNMVELWVKTGKVLQQSGDKYLFITRDGAAVVNKLGQVITAYGSDYFDLNMLEIIKKLFG